MAVRVLADFHHLSLYSSLQRLFEDRLGMRLYKPMGMEWWEQDYWRVFPAVDTAKQYLDLEQAFTPPDGTPVLNEVEAEGSGIYYTRNPEYPDRPHRGISLEAFAALEFDYIIASMPEHIGRFRKLRDRFHPKAKLIVQVGNNWNLRPGVDFNGIAGILRSAAPSESSIGVPVVHYHQEFDRQIFRERENKISGRIASFVNVIQQWPAVWAEFCKLEELTAPHGVRWASYGGQNRDGSIDNAANLAETMAECDLIYHVKPGGDGFGHVLHNAYALGRPVIARPSQYAGTLGGQLLVPGTFLDLDRQSLPDMKNTITRLQYAPELLHDMGHAAAARFNEVVDYDKEQKEIEKWLGQLS